MSQTAPHTLSGGNKPTIPVPPFVNFDLYSGDRRLVETLTREAPGIDTEHLRRFGLRVGSAEFWRMADAIQRHPPELHVWDRSGDRIDEVEYHPDYHHIMRCALEAGTSAAPWKDGEFGHRLHAALEFLLAKVEPSVCCPVTMTYAAPAAFKHSPGVAAEWIPRIATARYDPANAPASSKAGVTIGMAMTEKQGGSDLRANTTRAEPVSGGWYILNGHKWFCSAPMSDAFLTLAQAKAGLTCFLVPRFHADGTRNGMQLSRLKNKIGDRGNASSEIEYHHAEAVRIGEEGRGIRTLIDMVHLTRLDCTIAPAAYMQTALSQALWYTAHRSAFGKTLMDHSLMQRVLAGLAVESEAATMLAFRLARSFDEMERNETARLFSRVATPIAKYWLNKRVVGHVAECMECHGGNGYVEDWPIARFYRQAPLNGIWEGSGNIICLDVLRALARHPDAIDVLLSEIRSATGMNTLFDRAVQQLLPLLRNPDESLARLITGRLALLLQASLMLRYAPQPDSHLFCAALLGDEPEHAYGASAATADLKSIIDRARQA